MAYKQKKIYRILIIAFDIAFEFLFNTGTTYAYFKNTLPTVKRFVL